MASQLDSDLPERDSSPLITLDESSAASPHASRTVVEHSQLAYQQAVVLDESPRPGRKHSPDDASQRTAILPKTPKFGRWRRVVGWLLLAATVFMWAIANFLFSFMFADLTWSKPLFVTYINSASFVCALPVIICTAKQDQLEIWKSQLREWHWVDDLQQWRMDLPSRLRARVSYAKQGVRDLFKRRVDYNAVEQLDPEYTLSPTPEQTFDLRGPSLSAEPLTLPQTIIFSFCFAPIWFLANYFTAWCFEYTSVASGTVIVSTSSFWALIIGRIYQVETINWQKLVGVFASLIGVLIIFVMDLWGNNNDADHRGDFPKKSRQELALGSLLALSSAIMYGVYGTYVKKTLGDETQANMPLIFTLVGLINAIFFAPVLVLFHLTGWETFTLPPTVAVLVQLLVNSVISVISDYCWFYAVLLTSPVIVTVVLSFTIPITLVGQIISRDQYATPLNVVGSLMVLAAGILVQLEWGSPLEPTNNDAVALPDEEDGRIEG